VSLYHPSARSRSANESGLFRSHATAGTRQSPGGEYRGWSYHFVQLQTGTSVKRTSYCVSICDPHHNRVEYLRGFSSTRQAAEAAHHWIDELLDGKPSLEEKLARSLVQGDSALEKIADRIAE